MMQIAVLARDKSEADLACAVLRQRGHDCAPCAARDVAHAADGLALVLADLHHVPALLPALEAARARGLRLPLLLLADADEQDRIASLLNGGADDYLLRPLRRGELAARAAVLLRRFHPRPAERLPTFGDHVFDPVQKQAFIRGKQVALTQKEFDLALLFFQHLGRPLSRAYMQEAIWPGQADAGRSVDTHVSRVRSKLGLRPENGYRLAPVYSFGYRLEQVGA